MGDRACCREKILAIEVRAQRFAFVVIDGPRLLDFGARRFPNGHAEAVRKLDTLLRLHSPRIIAARPARCTSLKSSRAAALALRRMGEEIVGRGLKFEIVPRGALIEFFAARGYRTKHEIAVHLAERFEEIAWWLPKKRKPWEHEDYVAAIFDALATAIYLREVRVLSARKRNWGAS